MKGVITTRDLDRGEALTGVARVEKEKREQLARDAELALVKRLEQDVKNKMRAISKKSGNKRGKGKK